MNKIMMALSTALILGTASAAFAAQDAENRIGDRYPGLESTVQTDALRAFAQAPGVSQRRNAPHAVTPFTFTEKAWFGRAVGPYY